MKTETKTMLLIATATAAAWWFGRLPKIKVISTNTGAGGITYTMSINGQSITDTYYPGDAPSFIPTGDGTHFFSAFPVVGVGAGVELSIGYYDTNGGYKSIKSIIVE